MWQVEGRHVVQRRGDLMCNEKLLERNVWTVLFLDTRGTRHEGASGFLACVFYAPLRIKRQS